MEPTELEIEEHYSAGHVPHRTWCRHCIAGRGKADHHLTKDGRQQSHMLHADYGFIGDKRSVEEMDRENIPFVVVKDANPPAGTRWIDAHPVQSKGIKHEYQVQAVAADIVHAGYANFIFKTDGEPAIVALKREAVAEARGGLEDCVAREADALHARHDETQRQLQGLRANIMPLLGPDEERHDVGA